MSGMSAVNLAAASTVSNGDPELMQTIAEGLQLIHVLQVYTSSMVSLLMLCKDNTLNGKSQMALAVWDWLVCIRGQFSIVLENHSEAAQKRGSGVETDLEKTMVAHQRFVYLDTLLWNSMFCT